MATSLDKILLNFYWLIEAIDPTYTSSVVTGRFRRWDPEIDAAPDEGTGWARRFWVEWMGSGSDDGATSDPLREAPHTFRLYVFYPRTGQHLETQKLVVLDRHDLTKTLRGQIATDHRRGYDDDHPTTAIGLILRKRTGDQLLPHETNDRILLLTMEWLCDIAEDET